jgi:tRNA G18 (ribose-2'-O)-methylase SpoU
MFRLSRQFYLPRSATLCRQQPLRSQITANRHFFCSTSSKNAQKTKATEKAQDLVKTPKNNSKNDKKPQSKGVDSKPKEVQEMATSIKPQEMKGEEKPKKAKEKTKKFKPHEDTNDMDEKNNKNETKRTSTRKEGILKNEEVEGKQKTQVKKDDKKKFENVMETKEESVTDSETKPLSSSATVYGFKCVLDALKDNNLHIEHIKIKQELLNNEKKLKSDNVQNMLRLCAERNITVVPLDGTHFDQITKCGKTHQSVLADIKLSEGNLFRSLQDFIESPVKPTKYRMFGLQRITTPGTLGAIINTAVACGKVDYFLIAQKNTCPPFNPFAIKSSNGAVFKSRIIFCENLLDSLPLLKSKEGAHIALITTKSLSDKPSQSLFSFTPPEKIVYVFHGEMLTPSDELLQLADTLLTLPTIEGIDRVNVAVFAGLISYLPYFRP